MASTVTCRVSPFFTLSPEIKPRFRVRVQSLDGSDSTVLSSNSVVVDGTSFIREKEKNGAVIHGGIEDKRKSGNRIGGGKGNLNSSTEKRWVKDAVLQDLEVLWDDGYGTKTIKDFLDGAKEIIRPDGGPPRWFCPIECGKPLENSPILVYLPGLDGIGLGLTLHHKALGKAFQVWCLHIPLYDRTSFEALVRYVEKTVRSEHGSSPDKPIYLVGDSFGGCLALAVAARNPKIDIILVLANPATSFERSQWQPLFPIFEALPVELRIAVPYLLGFVLGNPLKMATVGIDNRLPARWQSEQLSEQFSANLTAFLSLLSGLAGIIPKDTLLWKLKLLKSAAACANSRLHAVNAEVLVLASGKDYVLPSGDEAQRLKSSLHNCMVRYFKENGHTLLLEDNINLLTVIKGTSKYRRSRRIDFVSDFLPPSMSELRLASEALGLFRTATCSAMYSTLDNGKIVKGLDGIPSEGPVLFVGHHMLMGFEVFSLVEELLREKNIMVRGVAHPEIFLGKFATFSNEFSILDWMKVMGPVPVSASNLFKLLSAKSHVLLYPGGSREGLHYKGEAYKIIWPDQPEFVRMAARFGTTIVPFGTVGEDDIAEMALDYHDLMKIPVVNDLIRDLSRRTTKIRDESKGEVANPELALPWLLPKVPGRFYYLFGKPIRTKGREEELLKDKESANLLYLEIKSEVKRIIDYLLKKREEDPYRNVIDRSVYRAFHAPVLDVPAFDP